MTCQGYNIKIVEGNAFALVLPLKRRTFVSERPIDEDIDILSLENVVVKIGDVVYANTLEEDGVHVLMPATLSRGTYQIELTAVYQGSAIRAAYFEAFTIVAWNYQSDAQQYIAGSPIVLDAAYVIGGTLTDAELEALKEEYREKNAQLDQAIADAEEAKREWEQKAADLDGVAQEETSQEILTKTAKQGTNPNATNTAILAAVEQGGAPQVVVPDITASQELAPNTLYIFPNRTSDLVLTLGAPIADIANEYHLILEVGATLPTITLPAGLTWKVEYAPVFDINTSYEVSILDNYAIFVTW